MTTDEVDSAAQADGSGAEGGFALVLEYFTQEIADTVVADQEVRAGDANLSRLASAVMRALRPEDLQSTRLVITADLVASVNAREDRTHNRFTTDRGAGTVAAKTMPPDGNGIVDILVPVWWVLPVDGETENEAAERIDYLQHVAAHEAIHASLFHIGGDPFDLHRREKLPYAMANFVSMASEQAEEHLAEFLGAQATGRRLVQTAEQVDATMRAWQDTLATKLPAVDPDGPRYFERGMLITFEALHIVWKSLAYLAAALRIDDGYEMVPAEVVALPAWQQYVATWWPRYIELLHEIPMTAELDIPAMDEVIRKLAQHLQAWADDIGFDFHDTSNGGYFRIKLWDDPI